jgi:hypothetical protein
MRTDSRRESWEDADFRDVALKDDSETRSLLELTRLLGSGPSEVDRLQSGRSVHRCRQYGSMVNWWIDTPPAILPNGSRVHIRLGCLLTGIACAMAPRPRCSAWRVRGGPPMCAKVRACGCHVGCHGTGIWRGWMGIEPTQDASAAPRKRF